METNVVTLDYRCETLRGFLSNDVFRSRFPGLKYALMVLARTLFRFLDRGNGGEVLRRRKVPNAFFGTRDECDSIACRTPGDRDCATIDDQPRNSAMRTIDCFLGCHLSFT